MIRRRKVLGSRNIIWSNFDVSTLNKPFQIPTIPHIPESPKCPAPPAVVPQQKSHALAKISFKCFLKDIERKVTIVKDFYQRIITRVDMRVHIDYVGRRAVISTALILSFDFQKRGLYKGGYTNTYRNLLLYFFLMF